MAGDDHDNLLSSSSDEELFSGFPVRTAPEMRACNMRMIAKVRDSLDRVKAVCAPQFAVANKQLIPKIY